MGTKYHYRGNNDPHDRTEKLTNTEGGEDLVLNGEAVELTDEEHARLSTRYQLESEGAREAREAGEAKAAGSEPSDASGETSNETPDTPTPSSPSEGRSRRSQS